MCISAHRRGASPPSWAAWIETAATSTPRSAAGRRPRGRRGLKHVHGPSDSWRSRRRPRGRRGLKHRPLRALRRARRSPPSWAAWIETPACGAVRQILACRRPRGRRGLKRAVMRRAVGASVSPPSWAAWIETAQLALDSIVLPRRRPRGRRGLKPCPRPSRMASRRRPRGRRGLKHHAGARAPHPRSPPSWAAWIETAAIAVSATPMCRRPRGRRGLKRRRGRRNAAQKQSPPSWAAWIETAGPD